MVGPEDQQRSFYINEDLLTHSSQFFQGALSGGFIEGQTKIVHLSEDDTSVFELFVQYLIRSPFDESNVWSIYDDDDYPYLLVNAYVLGDKLLAQGFKLHVAAIVKNVLIDRAFRMEHFLALVKSAYQLTSKSNGTVLREVLVWSCAKRMQVRSWDNTDKWTEEERRLFLNCGIDEFLLDVLATLCEPSGYPSEPLRDPRWNNTEILTGWES